jgi:hypothetical protein
MAVISKICTKAHTSSSVNNKELKRAAEVAGESAEEGSVTSSVTKSLLPPFYYQLCHPVTGRNKLLSFLYKQITKTKTCLCCTNF